MKKILLLALCWAGAVQAATIPVTPETFPAAWTAAQGGDVLVAGPGRYAGLVLRSRVFTPPLRLDFRAATVEALVIKDVAGLEVLGGNVRCPAPCYYAVRVYNGTDISFTGVSVTGPEIAAPGVMGVPAGGIGIGFDGSARVSVTGSIFVGLKTGVAFGRVTDLKATGNRFSRMGSDGVQVAMSQRGLIEGNVCDGSSPLSGAHPDCAQMYSQPGFPPTSDIVVRGNLATGDTQGFTGFSKGDADGGFDRITMEDNDVTGSHPQGLALYNARDSIVRNNHVRTMPGAQFFTNIAIVGGSVARCGNVAEPALGKKGVRDPDCVRAPTPAEVVEIAALKAKVAAAEDAGRVEAERLKGRLAQIAAMATAAP